jgi:hypothetical protein
MLGAKDVMAEMPVAVYESVPYVGLAELGVLLNPQPAVFNKFVPLFFCETGAMVSKADSMANAAVVAAVRSADVVRPEAAGIVDRVADSVPGVALFKVTLGPLAKLAGVGLAPELKR